MTRNILAERHVPVLADFAASNVLLAFDYDGTLAPIAPTPAAARMRTATRRLLAQATRRYPCVVISGRPLNELRKRLQRIPVWHLVGDHGHEVPGTADRQDAHVDAWAAHLREKLPGWRGLMIEKKKHSVTVHYRQVRDKAGVAVAIAEAIDGLSDARAVGGAEAVNLIPREGVNKGTALQQARRVFACDTAIYVGDDETDEDAFASAPADRLLAICVGTRRPSCARYRLRSQREVDALLTALIAFRAPRSAPAARSSATRPWSG